MAIIALLASVVMASLNSARSKSRDARRKSDLHELSLALNLYYQDNNSYPTCDQLGYPSACMWSSWSGWVNMLPSQYISKVPVDPQNIDLGNCNLAGTNCHLYRYCSLNSGAGFILAVDLENTSSMSSNVNCLTGGPNHYWVQN